MAPNSFIFTVLTLYTLKLSFSLNQSDYSVIEFGADSLFHGDYTPPSPPPPIAPPHPPSLSCERDLSGIGTLETVCQLNSSITFQDDNVYVEGSGSFHILPGVTLRCPISGCLLTINVTGEFVLGRNSAIIAGTVYVSSSNASFLSGSVVNVTGLAGEPPAQTSGTPNGIQGAGGGHGGRGANCIVDNMKLPDDVWGGDAYSWSSLEEPSSYGSKGGTTSEGENFGGEGGGRIRLEVVNEIEVSGSLLADGGDGGEKGGGGSGGSVFVKAHRMTGNGKISASGGNGFAGGGGGRISINVFSRHDDAEICAHGGSSFGCPENAGAAGTYYDAVPRRLIVSNHNLSTNTDTLLLEFPKQLLWTNVYILDNAKASVPLFYSRVQVRGQIRLSHGVVLSFGLAWCATSEFELLAEELLMSDSVVKIYGALRMSVKMHLMWNSKMIIDAGNDAILATSMLEATNLVVLKESSVIRSNANLGVHGQGFLNLSGPGDTIEAQRLILSLFFSINVGPGSVLRGPLKNASTNEVKPRLYCDRHDCPVELLYPPEDCNLNSSLSFTLQICRAEKINVEGIVKGSVVLFHWVRTVVVHASGAISASGLGCTAGVGKGKVFDNGLGAGGGGHGGKGGKGYYNGSFFDGGAMYGDADLPCELGSGSGNASLAGATAGGGIVVMGSLEHSLTSLSVYGAIRADGESFEEEIHQQYGRLISNVGPGGGSGGTILLFIHSLVLDDSSFISTTGGHGSHSGGGGGGGGRIHFHWSNILTGDEYLPLASVKGSILTRGGLGRGQGLAGGDGTVTGKACPRGLYGVFCEECPVGTFKNVSGSDRALCRRCPSYELPRHAIYIPIRGGVTESPCPYKCVSETYHMPHCYTTLEELVYTFGGPWWFGLILLGLLILLAFVLSVARMKYMGGDELPALLPASRIDHSFPFLESLNEVLETNRTEESQSHVHRMYFMGPNTFSEPWHLPHSPPEQVIEIVASLGSTVKLSLYDLEVTVRVAETAFTKNWERLSAIGPPRIPPIAGASCIGLLLLQRYEDAFNRFVDEVNAVAAYQWWEGSVYSILSVLAYPLAWSWLEHCRKNKLQQLREFVRSEYDHSCLSSCRSRALYEGLKVAATADLVLAYVDFFLGGDEKRTDLPPRLNQRFPLSLCFGGDGSYMTPFSLHNDNVLTSLMSQSVPPTIWYRLVAGLNAQLRLVHCGHLKITFGHVISWLETHANPSLCRYGIRVDLTWFHPTSSGYLQFGVVVHATENRSPAQVIEVRDASLIDEQVSGTLRTCREDALHYLRVGDHLTTRRRIIGGILDAKSLQSLKTKKAICYPFTFVVHNSRPVGHQDLVGLLISVLLLADFSLGLLTLLQMYSISLLSFFLVLFILPFGLLFPFPAGISALFSHGPRRSAGLARVYALWNLTSLINVTTAFICGYLHHRDHSSKNHSNFQSWNFSMAGSEWWMLPSGLLLCKIIQARLIDYHVANQEIQDYSLYSKDPDVFWLS